MTAETDRSGLLATKLRLLLASHWPHDGDRRERRFPDGAAALDRSGRCWVLTEGEASHRLGAVLAVALRAGCHEVHLLTDDATSAGVLARRAQLFAEPPSIWLVDGADLAPAKAAPAAIEAAPAPEAELYRPVLQAAGLDPVVEDGNLVGEWLGLEVGRVIVGADGSAHVEAGVGRFDREVAAMMFAELGEADSLARAVDLVARFRRVGAERHPLNHLVAERWLRWSVLQQPSLAGVAALRAVGSALARRDLKSDGVATAVGVDDHGLGVVVVCSTGVWLDLVPSAADDRLGHAPDARLVLVLPERDAVPVTRDLNALLAAPADVVVVPDDWRRIDGTTS